MGIQLTQFRLYQYAHTKDCVHKLLVRVNRPSYPNYSQTADNAAEDFADSAAEHLRTWWQRWLLPSSCDREHESRLLEVLYDPITDDLLGPGLRQLMIWVATVDDEPLFGTASTEDEFWYLVNDYSPESAQLPRPQAVAHSVYFLTERDGEGDLRDA